MEHQKEHQKEDDNSDNHEPEHKARKYHSENHELSKHNSKLKLPQISFGFFIAYILVSIFFLLNMNNLAEYGLSWDEPTQHTIGWYNINKLTGSSEVLPVIGLAGDVYYYGPFFESLNYVSYNIARSVFHFDYTMGRHFLILIIATFGLFFTFLLARKMFDERIALFSLGFLALFPWFIAHSHYNSKDIPAMALSLIAMFFLYSAFKEHKPLYAILAGLFLGLAVSTIITSLVVLLIFFVPYFVYLVIEKGCFSRHPHKKLGQFDLKKELSLMGIFLLTTIIAVFISWPALWSKPGFFFESLNYFLHHGWQGKVLYFGQIYSSTGVPWHYAPMYLLMVTPLLTLIFFFAGIVIAIIALLRIFKKQKHLNQESSQPFQRFSDDSGLRFEYLLLLFWLAIPILLQLSPTVPKYGGIRHFFIVIPALAILAGIGLGFIVSKTEKYFDVILETEHHKNHKSVRRIENFLPYLLIFIPLLLISSMLLFQISKVHPFEGSYYNEFVQAAIPDHIENQLELEYWGPTYRQGMAWIHDNVPINSSICVPIADHLPQRYLHRADLIFSCGPCTKDCYVMTITLKTMAPEINSTPIYKISRLNSDLLHIHKMK